MSVGNLRRVALAGLGALALQASSSLAAEVCNPNQALSGAALFSENCAACHGADATGGKTPKGVLAPNLTVLTSKGQGKFPAPRLADIIRYGGALPDHTISQQMPVWAKVFYLECGPEYSRRVVVELMKYVESLQK